MSSSRRKKREQREKQRESILMGISYLLMVMILICGYANRTITTIDESEMFTQEEIESAIKASKKSFKKNFRSCRLLEISYNEELAMNTYNAEWADQFGDEETIILNSTFATNAFGVSSTLEPDKIYENWRWVLTKSNDEEWIVRQFIYE